MSQFEKEKEQKETQISLLTKELTETKLQIRSEKRKLDDIEEQEDQLDEERNKLLAELEMLDEEFELLEHGGGEEGHDEDDDLLLQKLEQEAIYINKLLQSADDEYNQTQDEIQKISTSNQMLELENKTLEKKLKEVVDLEPELAKLQKELTFSLDEEKRLFDENLKLLNALKVLEMSEQESQKIYSQKEGYLNAITEQAMLERKARQFDDNQKGLNEKLDAKTKSFNQIKSKLEQSMNSITDADLKKVVGIETFRQKLDKFGLDLNQILADKEQIQIKKLELNQQINIKDIKTANKDANVLILKQLQVLEQELDSLIQRENDIVDINRLMKSYLDLERDTETEYLRRCKNLKDNKQQHIITLIQENVFADFRRLEDDGTKRIITSILYDIDDYDTQKDLNIELLISYLKSDNEKLVLQANKDVKFFYQLQFIEMFSQFSKKQEMKQAVQNKLKKINDSISELDKILQQNSNNLDNLQKEASYLKESEFSPIKGRVSIIYGVKGDLEKENEVQIQNKQIEQQVLKYEAQKQERDKLKKLLKQYQQKFDDLDLENSNLVKFEELIDEVNGDLEYKTEELREHLKSQNDNEIKQIESQVQDRIEKFQQKRQILAECRHEEKEKRQDIIKCDSQAMKLQSKLEKLDKDLKSQTAGLSLSEDKQSQLNHDIKEIDSFRQQMASLSSELESQKQLIHGQSQELNLIGDKIVSLDHLKNILNQLQEMNKLKKLQDQMKFLGDIITAKEQAVEQFISDVLGGSLFDCERKFKEAEQFVEKIAKKIIDTNNGMNDFEIDVKKGLHLYTSDEDLSKEGKKLLDENLKDRKDLKSLEDQKNLIRKVLHKIKNSLNDQEQLKQSSSSSNTHKITASTLEDFIHEIDTCVKKCEQQEKELKVLDESLDKRKEGWNKLIFKGGAKEALIDDIDKALRDNQFNSDSLKNKLAEIDKIIKGLDEVSKSMQDNPDYELRKASIKKMLDSIQDFKKRRAEIQNDIQKVDSNIQKLKAAKDQGLRGKSLDQLQELAKIGEETQEDLSKQHKKTDSLLKDLVKKRQKLADGDIMDNLRSRIENLNTIDNKTSKIEEEQAELEKIIQEATKVNPGSVKDSVNKINEIKKDVNKALSERENLRTKIQSLKDKMKTKDLNRDDPTTFIPIINELKDLRILLQDKDSQLDNLSKSIKFLKNKHGNVDMEKKFEQFRLKASDLQQRLQSQLEDQEVLKELFEEFDGYTSDTQEEDFIDRLGIEIKEIGQKHKKAVDANEKLTDKIAQAQLNISKQQESELKSQEIEKRALLVSEIEEEAYVNERLVEDIDYRINRNKKVFLGMPAREKLGRREQEILELSKRLAQFDNQVNEIDLDIQEEIYQLKQQPQSDESVLQLLEQISAQMSEVKKGYQQPGLGLKQLYDNLETLKQSQNYHQFDLLKQNIKIKKQILTNLALIKQVRVQFNQLKVQFDNNKPKKQIAYKPMKGDYVDQLLADWVNNNNCPVPISRMGNGFYMFGSKKIFAKIMNGKLLIRVGGGYMGIDEFMFYYGAQELNKMLAYEDFDDNEELDLDKVLETEGRNDFINKFSDGKSVIGAQQFKKRLSPRPNGPSPRTGSPRGNNASHPSPRNPLQRSPSGRSNTSGISGQTSKTTVVITGRKSPNPSGSFIKQGAAKITESNPRQ